MKKEERREGYSEGEEKREGYSEGEDGRKTEERRRGRE